MNIAQQFRQEGLQKGLITGRQEGLQKGRLDVAKAMLLDRTDLKTVARYTHLSVDELKKLQTQLVSAHRSSKESA